MSFDRDKRVLVAGLAALAPIPLPFNEVIGWPALILYWLGVALFAWRVSQGRDRPIPNWLMNLLGLAYLPIFVLEFSFFWQGRLLRPLVHLALFALVVKLFGMRRERDKWQIFLLIFFLFVASMGSSVHPSVLIFLVAFFALSILVLAKFASFHLLSNYGVRTEHRQPLRLRGFVITSTVLTILGAIPLFVLLPRLGGPYLVGPGGGGGGGSQRSKMSDSISLDAIGRVRTSREVVLRISYETPPPVGHEKRFRGGVYTDFVGNGWEAGQRESEPLRRGRDGFFRLSDGRFKSWATIWLEPIAVRSILVPVEAVALDLRSAPLQIDAAGVVSSQLPVAGTLNYRVGMAPETRLMVYGSATDAVVSEARKDAISPAIADLARRVAGSGSVSERAGRIEAYLASEYRYTLDLVGTRVEDPVEAFLFEWREGHCEYFATAMVLMLRSIGIPARLVTGYLGGEYNPFEGYYVLRQSDAHAWVESFSPELGWAIYDPTPASGRPSTRSAGLGHMLSQAYDYLVFRWDRYVLTYGFFDQVGIARRLLVSWKSWLRSLRSSDPSGPVEEPSALDDTSGTQADSEAMDELEYDWTGAEVIPFLVLILFSGWWIWRHRPQFTAVRAYRRLRSGVERSNLIPLVSSVAPLKLAEEIARHKPSASEPARRVIDLYLRESFGGQPLDEGELADLRLDVREAMQRLRKSA